MDRPRFVEPSCRPQMSELKVNGASGVERNGNNVSYSWHFCPRMVKELEHVVSSGFL